MLRRLLKILRCEEAATSVEYAVMLALILGMIIGTIGSVGSGTGGMFSGINEDLTKAGFGD